MRTILPDPGRTVDQVQAPDAEHESGPSLDRFGEDLFGGPIDWGSERGPWLEPCRGCITRHWDARRGRVSVDPDALRALDRGAGQ